MADKSQGRKRKLAELVVEAEAGLHEYADGTPSVDRKGKPIVRRMSLMVEAGYTPYYANRASNKVFNDDYFLGQKELIERQKAGGLMRSLMGMQERTGVFSNVADRMAVILEDRLNDPKWVERIKTEDLFKYALQYHKLDLEINGALAQKGDKMAVVFMDAEERLPKESRDKLYEAKRRFHELKSAELDSMAKVGDALDEVIEVEAVEEA
jgi:hypothetical protein